MNMKSLYNMHTRREFMKTATHGSLATIGLSLLSPEILAALEKIDSMKIIKIEAISFNDRIHIGGGSGGSGKAEFCWVKLYTDRGIVGMGETYPFSNGEIGTLRDYADELLGKDPRNIDGVWKRLYHNMAMRNAGGADMRIISAVNMAQLDILGQASGLPLYRLLGGKTRTGVKVYNTTTD